MKQFQKPALIFLSAFIFRALFVVIFAGTNYYSGISDSFLELAQNILNGKGAVVYVDIAPLSSHTSDFIYAPFYHRPFGYIGFVLVPLLLSSNPVSIQVLQAFLAGLSSLLVYSLAKKVTSENFAYLAALLYALWPLSARFEISILPDALVSLFLLLTVWCLTKNLEKEKTLTWNFLAGISNGIAVLMRPEVALLPFFLLGTFFVLRQPTFLVKKIALFAAGMLIVIIPQTIQNYRASEGHIIPLGIGNGISMWEGISQFGDKFGTVFGDERAAEHEGYRNWGYPNGVERDQERFREAVNIIISHPLWYAGMMVERIPVLLTPDWIMTRKFAPSLKEYLDGAPNRTMLSFIGAYPIPAAIRALLIMLQYVSFALALYGFVKKRPRQLLWFPACIVFYYIVIHIPTNSEARYFYPAIPFVLILASEGLRELKERYSSSMTDTP
ncbi:MAG: glycosyltransferase family 39 protein [Bacteroidota bacterium]|nr:glycosyltransferase family 39 protein [Bacteroidota bacterium]